MNRGPILREFEHAANNSAPVHRAMQLYYADHCSLEDALMIAVVELAEQNSRMLKAAALAPPPIFIVKPPNGGT